MKQVLLIGHILWINYRDGQAVIEDPAGNEWCFDSSVADFKVLKRKDTVRFYHNKRIKDVLCARNIVKEII